MTNLVPYQAEDRHVGTSFEKWKGEPACLEALAAGADYQAAANAAGISRRQVVRRMADAEYRGAVRRVRAELLDSTAGKLAAAAPAAVDCLNELLDARATDPVSARLAAAAILAAAERFAMLADTEERLQAVEIIVKRVPGKPTAEPPR